MCYLCTKCAVMQRLTGRGGRCLRGCWRLRLAAILMPCFRCTRAPAPSTQRADISLSGGWQRLSRLCQHFAVVKLLGSIQRAPSHLPAYDALDCVATSYVATSLMEPETLAAGCTVRVHAPRFYAGHELTHDRFAGAGIPAAALQAVLAVACLYHRHWFEFGPRKQSFSTEAADRLRADRVRPAPSQIPSPVWFGCLRAVAVRRLA